MTSESAPSNVSPEMEKWLIEADSFLYGKTPEELHAMYVLLNKVEANEKVYEQFTMATALHFKRNESDAIKVAQLMLQENEPKMRLEVCWILSGIMFTNEEAMKIIFERLLKDSDEEVFEGAYRYVHEDFSDAENVPLSNLLTVAQYLVEAETRQIALQSPR